MSRPIHLLNAKKIQHLKEPGRHSDGGGLYLRITKQGAKSWVFMTGKGGGGRKEIGLGPYASLTLAKAREIAEKMREAVATNSDPKGVIAPAALSDAIAIPTFGKFADDYISSVEEGWKNSKHRQQWRNTLRDYCGSLTDLPVDEISTDNVLKVLRPIWSKVPETADRVRNRIEKILSAAKAQGFRPKDAANPAQWRGHLELLLPKKGKLSRGHHRALPYLKAPTFIDQLQGRGGVAAKALEFLILTAVRTGNVIEAQWEEIDLKEKIWTIPAAKMKAEREHIVPLSAAAFELLLQIQPNESQRKGFIFRNKDSGLSNMAMATVLRRMKIEDVTVHGFRSTFRDWVGDATKHPEDLAELALAHVIKNKAMAAYRRTTAIERRRELMQDWADYLASARKNEDAAT